jgi:hypothetical protein
MQKEGKNEVLLLTRERIYLFNGEVVISLDLSANVVHDLDIKDRDGLFNLIVTFIQNNKLLPAQIYFVLAESVCFSKDFSITNDVDLVKTETLADEFIETIPFSSVISKTYKTATDWRVIGANQDLIDTIFDAFASRGFGLSALVPSIIFPDLATTVDLTPDKAQIVLDKKDLVVKASMVGEQKALDQQLTTTQTAVPKNKLLPYLAAAFILLIIILVVLLVTRK